MAESLSKGLRALKLNLNSKSFRNLQSLSFLTPLSILSQDLSREKTLSAVFMWMSPLAYSLFEYRFSLRCSYPSSLSYTGSHLYMPCCPSSRAYPRVPRGPCSIPLPPSGQLPPFRSTSARTVFVFLISSSSPELQTSLPRCPFSTLGALPTGRNIGLVDLHFPFELGREPLRELVGQQIPDTHDGAVALPSSFETWFMDSFSSNLLAA